MTLKFLVRIGIIFIFADAFPLLNADDKTWADGRVRYDTYNSAQHSMQYAAVTNLIHAFSIQSEIGIDSLVSEHPSTISAALYPQIAAPVASQTPALSATMSTRVICSRRAFAARSIVPGPPVRRSHSQFCGGGPLPRTAKQLRLRGAGDENDAGGVEHAGEEVSVGDKDGGGGMEDAGQEDSVGDEGGGGVDGGGGGRVDAGEEIFPGAGSGSTQPASSGDGGVTVDSTPPPPPPPADKTAREPRTPR
jgi:hypothetical protein